MTRRIGAKRRTTWAGCVRSLETTRLRLTCWLLFIVSSKGGETVDIQARIQGGLDVVRREAKGARGKRRSWKTHDRLMQMAARHVEACGVPWEAYESAFSRELAKLMRL